MGDKCGQASVSGSWVVGALRSVYSRSPPNSQMEKEGRPGVRSSTLKSGDAHACFTLPGVKCGAGDRHRPAAGLGAKLPGLDARGSVAATEHTCVLGRVRWLRSKTGGRSWCPEHGRPWDGQELTAV